jgi:hypothetical protein
MAENVQLILERMVPELEDLVRRKLLSRDELRLVIQRRTDDEYKFVKRLAQSDDFSRAIDYECSLDALRARRKVALGLRQTSSSDHSGQRRIHFIFQRACRRFASRESWWLKWLSYCRESKAHKATGRIVARALQLHPRSERLWLAAAAFEFDDMHSVSSTRAILQRSLRVNKGSQRLWLAYFKMECLYILKMKARRTVLGLDVGDGGNITDEKEEEEEEVEKEEIFEPELDQLEEEEEEGEEEKNENGENLLNKNATSEASVVKVLDGEEKEEGTGDAKSQFFAGAVPKLIYNQAIQRCCDKEGGLKVKDDGFGLRLSFLRAVDGFKDFLGQVPKESFVSIDDDVTTRSAFPDVVTFILTDIATRFPFDPRAWRVLSSRPMMAIESYATSTLSSDSSTVNKKEAQDEDLLFVVDKEGDKSLGIVSGVDDNDDDDDDVKVAQSDAKRMSTIDNVTIDKKEDEEEEGEDTLDSENDIGNGIRSSLLYSSLLSSNEWVNRVSTGSLDSVIVQDCFDLLANSVAAIFKGQDGINVANEEDEITQSDIVNVPSLHLRRSEHSWDLVKTIDVGEEMTKESTKSTSRDKRTKREKKRARKGVEVYDDDEDNEEIDEKKKAVSEGSGSFIRIAPTDTNPAESSSSIKVSNSVDSKIDGSFFTLVKSSLKKSTKMISAALVAALSKNEEYSGSGAGPSKKKKKKTDASITSGYIASSSSSNSSSSSSSSSTTSLSTSSSSLSGLQLQLGLYCVSAELHLAALSAIDAYNVKSIQGTVLRFNTNRSILTSLVDTCVQASTNVPTVTSKVELDVSSALELVLMQARVRLGLVKSALLGLEKSCTGRLRGNKALFLARCKLTLAIAAASESLAKSDSKDASITSAKEAVKEKDELMNGSVELLDVELFPWQKSTRDNNEGTSQRKGSASSSSSSTLENVVTRASESLRSGLSKTSGGITSSDSALPLWIALLELSAYNDGKDIHHMLDQVSKLFHEASLALSAQSVDVQDSLKLAFLRIINKRIVTSLNSVNTVNGKVISAVTSADLGKVLRWVTTPSASVSIHEAVYKLVTRSTLLLVKQFSEARTANRGQGQGGLSSASFSIATWKPIILDAVTLCRKTLDICASIHGKEAIGLWTRALKFERILAKQVPSSFLSGMVPGGASKDGATDVYERALLSLNDAARAFFCSKNV